MPSTLYEFVMHITRTLTLAALIGDEGFDSCRGPDILLAQRQIPGLTTSAVIFLSVHVPSRDTNELAELSELHWDVRAVLWQYCPQRAGLKEPDATAIRANTLLQKYCTSVFLL